MYIYIYKNISPIPANLIRFERIEEEQKLLYFTYLKDGKIKSQEFKGGDQWCSSNNTDLTCIQNSTPELISLNQKLLKCREGFTSFEDKCIKCSENCKTCEQKEDKIICSSCNIGFALGLENKCIECSKLIDNCYDCFFGKDGYSFEDKYFEISLYLNEQSLKDALIFPRCRQCIQKIQYYIPTIDLLKCDVCDPHCLQCHYVQVQSTQMIDHTQNPFIVPVGISGTFHKYCLNCEDSYFVKYDGTCEKCNDEVINHCDLCYYGENTGINKYYTLQNNFIYLDKIGLLKKKCFSCYNEIKQGGVEDIYALYSDGECKLNQSLKYDDGQCSKWRQISNIAFECVECKTGQGFNASLPPNERKCDLPYNDSKIINQQIPNCMNFYYSNENGQYSVVTCKRCAPGYVASAKYGCINCSTGEPSKKFSIEEANKINCKNCSLFTKNGFDFNYIMLTEVIGTTKENAIDKENNYQLNYQPYCNYCGTQKVNNICLSSCQDNCYKDACKTVTETLKDTQKCQYCGKEQYDKLWNLDLGISSNNLNCIQCPRYCQSCIETTDEEFYQINPYFDQTYNELRKYRNKCISCRTISEICKDYGEKLDGEQSGLLLSCTEDQQKMSVVFYDSSINKCTPCPVSNKSCTRTIKVQQIIECRPLSKITLGTESEQNMYYKSSNVKGTENLNHIFYAPVIILDQWNPTSPLEISFPVFNDITTENWKKYLALNDENVSVIEFEVLLIPNVQHYDTGSHQVNENSCLFANDVNFSVSIAKYIANIKKLSFTFKTIDPTNGNIDNDNINIFMTQFSFKGWNYYEFKNINFLPAYAIKNSAPMKQMLFKFSDNLFKSQLILKDIIFKSGVEMPKQETILKNFKTIFNPVLDLSNIYLLYIYDVKIDEFLYQDRASFFKFDQSNVASIPSFQLKIKKFDIYKTVMKKADFIYIFQDVVRLFLENITFDQCVLNQVNIIKQSPEYSEGYSNHEINLFGIFKIISTELTQTTIIDAQNLKTLYIKDFQIIPNKKTIKSPDQVLSLFTSNKFEIDSIQILIGENEERLEFTKMRIFSFPLSTYSFEAPKIIIKLMNINRITFLIDGGIFNLLTYPNQSNTKGSVVLDGITLTGKYLFVNYNNQNYQIIQFIFYEKQFKDCSISGSFSNSLMSFTKIYDVTINNLKNINFYGGNTIYLEQCEQVTIIKGSSSYEIASYGWVDIQKQEDKQTKVNEKFKGNKNNGPSQTGTVFHIKNLRGYFYLKDFTFEYQYVSDKIDHEKQIEQPVKIYEDFLAYDLVNKANTKDNYGFEVPHIIIEKCEFLKIGVYVYDPFLTSSVIHIETLLKYRIILKDLKIENVTGYTNLDTLFKDSSSFLVQVANDSSLYLDNINISKLTSEGMRNGFFVQTQYFTCLNSKFQDGNKEFYSDDTFSGGFLHIGGNQIEIYKTDFKSSYADQGGAIFLNGFGQTIMSITECKFEDVGTILRSESYGKGGAISIDGSTSSITLTISKSQFTNTIAFKQSGFLDLNCGNQSCLTTIQDGEFKNNYATSGSLFNIKFNKLAQKLFFLKNTIRFDFNLKGKQTILNSHFYEDSEYIVAEEDLNRYYMIVVQGGDITMRENTYKDLTLLQGLIYLTQGKVSEINNKILSSSFRFSPIIYYYKQTIEQLSTLTISNVKENEDYIEQENLKFLKQISDFDQFLVIESPMNNFSASDITINNVICKKCITGIFGVVKSTKTSIFKTFKFSKCQSKLGSLYLSGIEPAKTNSGRILQTSPQISLENSDFLGNIANFGGGIYVTLKQNSVSQQGGGIYFLTIESQNSSNQLNLDTCTITNNNADVGGGGIKIIGNFAQYDEQSTQIKDNTTKGSGANTQTFPIGLKVFFKGKEIQYNSSQQKLIIENWASGVTTDQELKFLLVGEDYHRQLLDSGQTATLTVDLDYNSPSEIPEDAKITGTTTINYDSTAGEFNLNKVMFQQYPQKQLQAKVTSSAIKIPIKDKNGKVIDVDLSYKLPLLFTMRKCIVGEAFIQTSGVCYKCDKETYSLVEESKQCKDCPDFSTCPGGNQINVKSGYWRPDEYSDLIESCTNQPQNCNGELNTGDASCIEGHIGALCEECDISARFWPESYSHSAEYQCGKCREVTGNTMKMVGLSIYTILAIFFSVKSTKALLDSYIITFYFQQIGFLQKKASQSQESVGIIIKLFTTYVQLFLVITTFKLKLPPGLSEVTVNVGDPVQQMTFSMDCGLYSISGNIPMTYFRLLWSQFMPVMYVCCYLLCFFIYQVIKREKNKLVIVWISFIYIYISMQPSIVRQNIQTVSCRSVSDILYIKSNVSERCYTSQHIQWSVLLILPTLMVWIVLIPVFFLWQMYKGRHKLKSIKMQYKFGFLYTEYKTQSYFWEIVKIYQKTLVTIFVNVYDSHHIVKGVLVVLVLLVYIHLQLKYQPYLERRFNELDIKSNVTVITSIIIAMFILNNPYDYLIWLGYILLITINVFFVFKLIRILISGYTQKFEAKLGDIYCKISAKYPKIGKLLKLPFVQKSRLNYLWKVFKNYVKKTYPKKEQVKEIRSEDVNRYNEKLAMKLQKKESKSLQAQQKLRVAVDEEEHQEVLSNYIIIKPKSNQLIVKYWKSIDTDDTPPNVNEYLNRDQGSDNNIKQLKQDILRQNLSPFMEGFTPHQNPVNNEDDFNIDSQQQNEINSQDNQSYNIQVIQLNN